jgi:hypothetical protein
MSDDDELDDALDSDDDEMTTLGACCVCESTVDVHNVILLKQRAPLAGRGWGCVVCGLPAAGAVAVICDACAEAYAGADDVPLRFACRGFPGEDGRVPIDALDAAPFDHDFAKHQDENP